MGTSGWETGDRDRDDDRLLGLHCAMRAAVLPSSRGRSGAVNANGDELKVFDIIVNDAALELLETHSVPILLESEETEAQKKIGTDYASTPTDEAVTGLHEAGLKVTLWHEEREDELPCLLDLGPYGIGTNDPERLKNLRRRL